MGLQEYTRWIRRRHAGHRRQTRTWCIPNSRYKVVIIQRQPTSNRSFKQVRQWRYQSVFAFILISLVLKTTRTIFSHDTSSRKKGSIHQETYGTQIWIHRRRLLLKSRFWRIIILMTIQRIPISRSHSIAQFNSARASAMAAQVAISLPRPAMHVGETVSPNTLPSRS